MENKRHVYTHARATKREFMEKGEDRVRETERESIQNSKCWEMKNVEHTLMISGRRPGTTGDMPEPVAEPAVDVVIIAADELCRDEKYS